MNDQDMTLVGQSTKVVLPVWLNIAK
jgi:hypothetical protein